MLKRIVAILVLIALAPWSGTVFAFWWSVLEFDQNATPNVIFGSDVTNGSFTTDRRKGVEVALRAKQRFPAANVFNSNGDGTYSMEIGNPCPEGFSPPPFCEATPVWSFEWSVNADFDDSTGKSISDYTYELGMDSDPGPRTKFTRFDPITPLPPAIPFFDHAIGDNSTPESGGTVAASPDQYQGFIENNNVAQNSWNYEFFNNLGTRLAAFDPNVDGNYIIYLRVIKNKGKFGKSKIVAQSFIQVLVGNAQPVKKVLLPRLKK